MPTRRSSAKNAPTMVMKTRTGAGVRLAPPSARTLTRVTGAPVVRMRRAVSGSIALSAAQPALEIRMEAPLGRNASLSNTSTVAPWRERDLESASAVARPHGPPPIMATSTDRGAFCPGVAEATGAARRKEGAEVAATGHGPTVNASTKWTAVIIARN
eukprot:scaffold87503_cov75-Phaeocystis_antarctica.AAC.1